MKQYPSIPRFSPKQYEGELLYTFDKVDGSNMRFEWNPKQGWYKFGSRNQLITKGTLILGPSIDLFLNTLADDLTKVVYKRWGSVVVFAEFWGPGSFAGNHLEGDKMQLSLLDVSVHKQGMLGPKDFLKYFGHLNTPNYLGCFDWDGDFRNDVRKSNVDGVTFEGVVGKAGQKHTLYTTKLKTRAWLNKVREVYGLEKLKELEGESAVELL